jgi:hypothetical protein
MGLRSSLVDAHWGVQSRERAGNWRYHPRAALRACRWACPVTRASPAPVCRPSQTPASS